LTDVFRDQVKREMGDGLREALGELGTVDVVSEHPKLDDVLKKGLVRALDGWRERSGVKTHFVLIDFSGVHYEIQARQHDGPTGLATGQDIPVVRRDRTRDRAFVARTAALLVERDLGLLGTALSQPDATGNGVRVRLRSGGPDVPIDRWVKEGDVFALATAAGKPTPIPWSYLQVVKPAVRGVCVCRLFSRFRRVPVEGLACVKVGTTAGPLRLRLLKENSDHTRSPMDRAVTVQIRRYGFEGEDSTRLQINVSPKDDVDTAKRAKGEEGHFKNLAFVTALSGEQVLVRLPVPVFDDRLVMLPVPRAGEESNFLVDNLRALERAVDESNQVQALLFKKINRINDTGAARAEALDEVRKALQRSREDHVKFSADRNDLDKEIQEQLPEDKRPSLKRLDRLLRQLRTGETELRDHLRALEKIDKEENAPQLKAWKEQVEKAKLLEKQAEVGEAIKIYKQILKEGYKSKDVKRHLAKLEKDWKTKGKAHEEAREFIYREWPELDVDGLKANIEKAEKALAECKKAGDKISPAKMLAAMAGHQGKIKEALKLLKPEVDPDDVKPAKELGELIPRMAKLDAALRAYLGKGE
jgi:hypothetical protein